MASTASQFIAPDEYVDEENRTQPWASRANKLKLVALACKDRYSDDDLFALSRVNPTAAAAFKGDQQISQLATEAEIDEADKAEAELFAEDSDGEQESKRQRKRSVIGELVLCLLVRSANRMVMPFIIACLSVVMLKASVSDDVWSLFTYMTITFNQQWAEEFCALVSSELEARLTPFESEHIKLAVFDNCSYMEKNTFQSAASTGGMLHTVNWLREPLAAAKYGGHVARGAWHSGARTFQTRRFFSPSNPRVARLKLDLWLSFMSLAAAGGDILARPAGPPPEPTKLVYMDPVLDVGTAKYADVDLVLHRILAYYITTAFVAASVVLLVGDQQSYHRMIWVKKYHPTNNDWFVPLPGEFHFVANLLMALHRLWYRSLSQWAEQKLGWRNTIKEDWGSVTEWHHYDRFYLLLISAITTYLTEIVPLHVRLQPSQLMTAVAGNATASMLVRFLYEFGYPYLELRNSIRTNDHATIDLMWVLGFHWFHACNKFQYAILCIYVTSIRQAMVPLLRRVWSEQRTVSLAGNAVSNVGHDLGQERMNCDTKSFVSSHSDMRDRLRKVASMLNAFRHICGTFLAALGQKEKETYERHDFQPADKTKLLTELRLVAGTSYVQLCAPSERPALESRLVG